MATPFLAGLAIAAAALAGKYGVQAWQAFKSRPPTPRIRKFYDGGFQPTMTRREAVKEKNAIFQSELLCEAIEDVGPSNVVQVIIDAMTV